MSSDSDRGSIDPEDDGATRYLPLGLVARGAMGEVHEARDPALLRKVAYKRISRADASEDRRRRFVAEARITAQLDHPNVVPVYALEWDDGSPAYAMKLVKGLTLTEQLDLAREDIARAGAPEPDRRLSARIEQLIKVCDAVAYAHSKGVVHRDLKPANVMIGRFGEVYVMDWGLARLVEMPDDEDTAGLNLDPAGEEPYDPTRVGAVIGTPAYMAPEQALGLTDDVGPASDVFALGLLLYEVAWLQHPYLGPTYLEPPDLLERAQNARLRAPDPRRAAEPVPPGLRAIMAKATQLDPDLRYTSAADLATDLRRLLRDEPVSAWQEGPFDRLGRWARHHLPLVLGAVVALAAIDVALIGLGVGRERVVVAEERTAVRLREQDVLLHLAAVQSRADQLDKRMLFYQGLVEGLAGAAVHAISHGEPESARIVHRSEFADPATAPSGMLQPPGYRDAISLHYAMWAEAPGVTDEHAAPVLARLSTLRGHMRNVLLTTPDGRITEVGAEDQLVQWVYVATERPGLILLFPGAAGDLDDRFDARDRPWYEAAEGTVGGSCGTPHTDRMGQGEVVSCTRALYDERGVLLGVAGLDLKLSRVVDSWLGGDAAFDGFRGARLTDATGRVLAATGEVPADLDTRSPSGVAETGDSSTAWARLDNMGWTYTVVTTR